jgi:preprotein translocase subunit SecF
MDIANPYLGDYKKLMILPILLAIVSILFITVISPLRLGVDFKGGIDLEISVSEQVNIDDFKHSLEQNGYVINKIAQNKRPSDYIIQAELSRSQKVTDADDIKLDFFELRSQVSELEAQTLYTNDSQIHEQYHSKRLELDEIANRIFSLADFEQNASSYSSTHLITRQVQEAHVHIRDVEENKLNNAIASALVGIDYESSPSERTATMSTNFLERAFTILFYSILLTSVVVFLIFRDFIPSVAVLVGAGADIIFALGAMSVFNISLTLASFSALLMLIGFSLDTDILLTIRVLKRKEHSVAERAFDSMKTGMTMSFSTMVAFFALFALALITHESIYSEISIVVIAGLFGDLIATWAFNAVMIISYIQDLERKGKTYVHKPLLSYIFKN